MSSVSLRRVTPDDAALIHAWRSEPTIAAYQPLLPLSLEEVREMLVQRSFTEVGPEAHGDFQWVIVDSGTPVGWISLKVALADRPHGKGSIGYAIGEAHRQRGYASAGLDALIPIAWRKLNLERLEAVAAVTNTASRRVLEANGFRFEGVQRGLLVIHGKRVDHAMYGLLRTDWEADARDG